LIRWSQDAGTVETQTADRAGSDGSRRSGAVVQCRWCVDIKRTRQTRPADRLENEQADVMCVVVRALQNEWRGEY
jgi:hypothetical protein